MADKIAGSDASHFKMKPKPSDFFTAEFLPPLAERKM